MLIKINEKIMIEKMNLLRVWIAIFGYVDWIWLIKSPFELLVLITQFSVSVTHNSKIVGPITKSLFGKQ